MAGITIFRCATAFIAKAFLCLVLAAVGGAAHAQGAAYPVKPVTVVVGFSAGGGSDVAMRAIAVKMQEALGQPIVVENRPGASGNIGAMRVVGSPPDGYTIYLATASNGITTAATRVGDAQPGFDFMKDLKPVVLLLKNQNVVVAHPAAPASNIRELVALARSKPGVLNFGTVSPSFQLANELFRQMADVKITDVPYKGGGPFLVDLMGGQIEFGIMDVAAVLPLAKAGKVKVLASTSLQRFSGLPDVPTLHESGLPGYEASGWLGLMAPAGVPADVVAKLNAAARRALATPELRDHLVSLGTTPSAGTPEEFSAFINSEVDKWTRVMRTGSVKLQN